VEGPPVVPRERPLLKSGWSKVDLKMSGHHDVDGEEKKKNYWNEKNKEKFINQSESTTCG